MKTRRLLVVSLAVVVWVCAVNWLEDDESVAPLRSGLSVSEVLGGDAAGFERVLAPRRFDFPADHGPHPDYRSEWWYVTGNLDDEQGRHFGFQLTFFRFGLKRPVSERKSAWAASDIYMGHFAVTDVGQHRMTSYERLSRDGLELAGARAAPFKVWIDDWRIESSGETLFPLSLHANEEDLTLTLTLEQGKPLVLQGDEGLSQKSASPGNASYYYSFTRLDARGSLTLGDTPAKAVRGRAWMDREWSTSALAKDQAGWDWFSVQLDDATELMFYQLRRHDGSADPHSAGALVDRRGHKRQLGAHDVELEPLDYWINPVGTRYPIRWRLRIPPEEMTLEIDAYVLNQELNHSVRYWEGAVSVHGMRGRRPVAGNGYLEMTGYGE